MPLALLNPSFSSYPLWLLAVIMLVCFLALNYGGDFLTEGSVAIATNLKINPVVIGLTVVSMATSMPEMITSLLAAKSSPGLALGNILGSNIANIGLILGITALISPLVVQLRLLQREVPLLILVTGLFVFFAIGGLVFWEGAVLLSIMAGYLYFVVRWAKQEPIEVAVEFAESSISKTSRSTRSGIWLVLLGAALLAIGADLLIGASVEVAKRMGISDVLIGLTIVAIGTSLPELAASISAARSGNSDICVGNVIGSNLFNLLLIGGGVSCINYIPVDPKLFRLEFPALIFITVLLLWIFKREHVVTRKEGAFLIFMYVTILALSSAFQLQIIF